MADAVHRHIVISAVNIRKGGTLTVLRDCLRYLSTCSDWQVTALVNNRRLCDYPGINYVEVPWSIRSWLHRLWCEYVTMNGISRGIQPVDLWFSLHDTTPRVKAKRQAVYCHTSFPFMEATWQDVKMDYKIPLFSRLTRFAYRINVRRNRYLVVQAQWMRKALSAMIHFPSDRIIVAPPAFSAPTIIDTSAAQPAPVFIYPCTPDCHKNIEDVCNAARLLATWNGVDSFRLVLTVKGNENRYARSIYAKFGDAPFIDFHGFMSQVELYSYYGKAACLIFPSRVETWGLPISEFKGTGKPMILLDRPYSRETAAGAPRVAFVVKSPIDIYLGMKDFIDDRTVRFKKVPPVTHIPPVAENWEELFNLLLKP